MYIYVCVCVCVYIQSRTRTTTHNTKEFVKVLEKVKHKSNNENTALRSVAKSNWGLYRLKGVIASRLSVLTDNVHLYIKEHTFVTEDNCELSTEVLHNLLFVFSYQLAVKYCFLWSLNTNFTVCRKTTRC